MRTSGDEFGLVFLVPHLLFIDVAPGEEEPHHPLEELVHQLDGERHHVHLPTQTRAETRRGTGTRTPLTPANLWKSLANTAHTVTILH